MANRSFFAVYFPRLMYMLIQCAMIIVILYFGRRIIFKKHYLPALIVLIVLTVLTWILYWKAALKNPGYVRVNCFKVDTEFTHQDDNATTLPFRHNRAPSTLQLEISKSHNHHPAPEVHGPEQIIQSHQEDQIWEHANNNLFEDIHEGCLSPAIQLDHIAFEELDYKEDISPQIFEQHSESQQETEQQQSSHISQIANDFFNDREDNNEQLVIDESNQESSIISQDNIVIQQVQIQFSSPIMHIHSKQQSDKNQDSSEFSHSNMPIALSQENQTQNQQSNRKDIKAEIFDSDANPDLENKLKSLVQLKTNNFQVHRDTTTSSGNQIAFYQMQTRDNHNSPTSILKTPCQKSVDPFEGTITVCELQRTCGGPRIQTLSKHNPEPLFKISPKPMPSLFTYQGEDDDEENKSQEIVHVANFTRKLEKRVSTRELFKNKQQSDKTDRIVVDLRYCTVCNIEQPLRSKHCRLCNQCISTYDHHCPWLGTCIGERNKKYFYAFLWAQLLQIEMGMYYSIKMIVTHIKSTAGIVTLVIEGLFLLFVAYLLIFHTYLALSNTTTWECLSWSKISYLKEWPRKYGSPFNIGLIQNAKLYFCYNLQNDNYFVWKMPKRLPIE